jgi:Rrf2 family transcriptional regulator, nitric oxide-sensitive transcriptional repressor
MLAMRLTLHTDYALRTLLYLAHTGRPAPVDAIATAFAISREHLVKVVQTLTRLGYVSTRSGRGGGVSLARDAAQIRVSDVVADVEGRQRVLDCVLQPQTCVLEPGCGLRRLLMQAEDAFYATLAGATIAELARPKSRKGGLHNLSLS